MQAPKRVYRSATDKMIAGICGGLAEYFVVDSTIVRLVFVILALWGGSGIFLYIVLWIIMPERPAEIPEEAAPPAETPAAPPPPPPPAEPDESTE